jgi:hypothetical protein
MARRALAGIVGEGYKPPRRRDAFGDPKAPLQAAKAKDK